jgi:hypothetical protein
MHWDNAHRANSLLFFLSCILRSADAFVKRGRTLLLFAKFVLGINTPRASDELV